MAGGGLETESSEGGTGGANARSTLGTYAELVRLPNLFTAPPDVILGAALVAVTGHGSSVFTIAGLAGVSMLLYAGGTTLNDAFDADVDSRERPDRPIPSGRVSREIAFGFGFGLLAVAVVAAFAIGGWASAAVAGAVAVAIVGYDGMLKETTAGFLAMGTARGLNVLLGTTAAGAVVLELSPTALAVPVVIVCYIAAVTFMASRETEGGSQRLVVVAVGGVVAALLVLGWNLVAIQPPPLETGAAITFAGAFCWWIARPLRRAYADPVPSTIGPAVGACILGLVFLDAAFAAVAGLEWALATAAFLVPAVVLSRVFDVT